jgi:putative tryptophan/tyrosine transport system ATP-binding protein
MLKLENISKSFNKGTPDEILALKPLSLEFEKKSFSIIIGANGSGKSTLLNLIAGTILPDQGQIILGKEDITAWKPFERSKHIARVFQNPSLGTAPGLTVLENFRLASLRSRSKGLGIGLGGKFKREIQELIASAKPELVEKINQPMGSLSGGQRQTLSILMSTMDHPQLLLLDEPTAALDPKSSEIVIEVAEKIIQERGITAIWVTHDLSLALKKGNLLIHLKNGSINKDIKDKTNLSMSEIQSWF